MRLIDADALLKSHCISLDGEYESCKECLEPPYGCCSLDVKGEDIFHAPTIDAIPVEWLKKRREQLRQKEYGGLGIAAITKVLMYWHEEQEAR